MHMDRENSGRRPITQIIADDQCLKNTVTEMKKNWIVNGERSVEDYNIY